MKERSIRVGLMGLIGFIGLAAGSALYATTPRWEPIGPEGGLVCSLAAAPSRPAVLYAGLRVGGVYKSLDRGRTWAFAGSGIGRNKLLCALAVDALAPGTVWAGTGDGLFETTDGGESWTLVDTGFLLGMVSAVATHPRRSGTVWVATPGRLLITRDGGETWDEGGAIGVGQVIDLVVDRLHPATLFAVTLEEGVFKSTDSGASWRHLRHLPGGLPARPIAPRLTIHPRQTQTLFLAVSSASPGVYRSTDGGASWRLAGLRGLSVMDVAVDAANPSIVYAATNGRGGRGFFRSTNGGTAWRATESSLPDPVFLLASGPALLAGSDVGISVSLNRGASWLPSRGLNATSIVALAVSSEDPPRIYAASFRAQWKTASRGAAWLRLATGLQDALSLAVAPSEPATVYGGFFDNFAVSESGGRRWSTLPLVFGCALPDRIVVDPTTPSTLYAGGGFIDAGCGTLPGNCRSFRSTDGARTWTCIGNGLPGGAPVLAVDPFAPSHLFASGFGGLYRSLDRGDSWSLLAADRGAWALALDQRTPGLAYAGFAGGVGRSIDGGATWEVHGDGLPSGETVIDVALDPVDPSVVYAATASDVYRSGDSGETWAPAATGLADLSVVALEVDPADPTILYAATRYGGVMKLEQDK